jgi:peptide chain release factor 1
MLERLENCEKRFREIEEEISKPEVINDARLVRTLAQERADLQTKVEMYRRYKAMSKELEDAKNLLENEKDEDMKDMVRGEIASLEKSMADLYTQMTLELLPKDPNDDKSIIMEIRAGTGGDEAGLFAADLYKMYTRYALLKNWKTEVIDINGNVAGIIKEVVFEVNGKGAFSRLKYERGVHRVQRVPQTEASGRIHTSTATVAVLPQAEEVDIDINMDDVRVDIFHSSGAGGQNVQKVATAIRLTHIPTGLVVCCQDERSQLKNKNKAFAVLRARLLELEQSKVDEERTESRRAQVGQADRSEKIRTYNFPQDRLTDHRIGLTAHNLPHILEGYLDEIIDTLATHEQTELLKGED